MNLKDLIEELKDEMPVSMTCDSWYKLKQKIWSKFSRYLIDNLSSRNMPMTPNCHLCNMRMVEYDMSIGTFPLTDLPPHLEVVFACYGKSHSRTHFQKYTFWQRQIR